MTGVVTGGWSGWDPVLGVGRPTGEVVTPVGSLRLKSTLRSLVSRGHVDTSGPHVGNRDGRVRTPASACMPNVESVAFGGTALRP